MSVLGLSCLPSLAKQDSKISKNIFQLIFDWFANSFTRLLFLILTFFISNILRTGQSWWKVSQLCLDSVFSVRLWKFEKNKHQANYQPLTSVIQNPSNYAIENINHKTIKLSKPKKIDYDSVNKMYIGMGSDQDYHQKKPKNARRERNILKWECSIFGVFKIVKIRLNLTQKSLKKLNEIDPPSIGKGYLYRSWASASHVRKSTCDAEAHDLCRFSIKICLRRSQDTGNHAMKTKIARKKSW